MTQRSERPGALRLLEEVAAASAFSLLLVMYCIGAPASFRAIVDEKEDGPANDLKAFVGVWKGQCQDKKTFVTLTLRIEGQRLAGTISIGNMQGDPDGQCVEVTDEPNPEHAQQISDIKFREATLSFKGAQRDDGTFPQFEMTLTGGKSADLKFLGTPVANNPWKLLRD